MTQFLLLSSLVLEFIGPCSHEPLFTTEWNNPQVSSVGALTISALEKNNISYKGNERGLNSAFGSPIGMDALEIISDREMRSYGWCFEVDGVVPEVYADEVPLTGVRKVRWFFAYAHYQNGQWISQCEPAHKKRPAFLCKK